MELFLAAGVGILIGVVVGMLGAGGGILSVPALVYLLGQSPHNAAAGSLVIVLISAFTSLIAHTRHKHVSWREGFIVGTVAAIAAVAGARVAPHVSESLLMALFSILLIAVAVMMLVRGRKARQRENHVDSSGNSQGSPVPASVAPSPLAITAAGTIIGFLAGMFGVGGGFAVVPLLVLVFSFSMVQAAGTSVLVMMLSAVFGLVGRIGTPVDIDWPIILIFAAGSAFGGILGEPISRKAKPSTLTIAFGVLLLIVAVLTVWQNA